MLSDILYRFRALFRRGPMERGLDEELQGHLDRLTSRYVASGMTPEEAKRQARLEFGGLEQVKEECRDIRGVNLLETLLRDAAFALRLFRKTPGISALALLSLALGIGANTAIFSLVNALLLRTLPVSHPEQLVQVRFGSPNGGYQRGTFTNPLWEQLRDRQDVFSGIFAWSPQDFDLADRGETQRVRGIYASGGYFSTLGVRPVAGRLFTVGDDERGCSGVVVLGYGFWQQYYGGAPSAVGSNLRLNGHSFQVVGVTSQSFFGTDVGDRFDVALPICAEAVISGKESGLDARSNWWLLTMGRLKPGIDHEQASARLGAMSPETFAAALPAQWPPQLQEEFRRFRLAARPADKGLSGFTGLVDQYQRPLEILMVLVSLVLLITCANIASLMVARSSARQREIAVRLALGGSRWRLIRQTLTESLLLSFAGAVVGVLFARWGGLLLVRLVSTAHNKVFLDLSMDGRVLAFTIAIAVLTGLIFGSLPAFRASRVSLLAAMKGSEEGTGDHRSRFRMGRWIVTAQVALSVVLLVGTALFARSFRNLVTLDPGFDPSNIVLVNLDVRNARIPPEARSPFYTRLLEHLKAVPGVSTVAQQFLSPMSGQEWNGPVQVEGYEATPGREPLVWFNAVTPGYFATVRMRLLRGRDFEATDTAGSAAVAIANEALGRQFFPNTDPIGKTLQIGGPEPGSGRQVQIVGLVRNAKYLSLREDFLPFVYIPLAQAAIPFDWSSVLIRTSTSPGPIIPVLRNAVTEVNRDVTFQIDTLSRRVDDTLTQERLMAILSGFFGLLALLLTAIGLYGVMAYTVTQRTREIGIRLALGAKQGTVLRFIVRDIALLLVAGMAAGTIAAYWLARFVQQMLFDLTPEDLDTLGLALSVLAAVVFLAIYLPARRAIRLNPMVALRHE